MPGSASRSSPTSSFPLAGQTEQKLKDVDEV
jgi:hypothetical protein